MSDIIKLLPDSVANQIAAGEVIQRPASVVKELVENAVDAGSDEITVLIRDAGRTLIQVIDNGIGMSDTDARLAFERHATSKIRNAQDLFAIRTKGFRGEALASIAAIAQVVLKTRQHDQEIGTEIAINGTEVEYQRPASGASGSNFIVKNLFYNVPARRKFLKSNSTEFKHIITEFQHIALAHPEVSLTLIHSETDIFCLPKTNLRQRIIHIFGKSINSNLNLLNSETTLVNLSGYIGKPELARRTSGEQFMFINQRFMRHPYYHRAITKAYEKLMPSDSFPSYFIYFTADPATIDVNIHPTKTEIKFENEQAIFQIIQAAVREALGKSSVVPSIDFETEGVIDIPVLRKNTEFTTPEISIDYSYNPFEAKLNRNGQDKPYKQASLSRGWETMYPEFDGQHKQSSSASFPLFKEDEEAEIEMKTPDFILLQNKFILTSVKSGIMLIDIKRAYERIMYEQFILSLAHNKGIAQRELFPVKMDLDPANYAVLQEIKDELALLGIDIGDLGSNTIVLNSCPSGIDSEDLTELIECLIEEYKQTEQLAAGSTSKNVAAALAKAAAKGINRQLQTQEIQQLIDELFACENPGYSPGGKKVLSIIKLDELEKIIN
jgi:DNA mismatch repair protein MutL